MINIFNSSKKTKETFNPLNDNEVRIYNNIEQKINDRLIAKQNKNFELADQIRMELNNDNINLMDTKENTFWEIKNLEFDYKEMSFK